MNVNGVNAGERIAVLMLETQEANKEVDRQLLDSARHDFANALEGEVQALKDQADAAFRGAVFQGITTVASGGLGVAGAAAECERNWMTSSASALGMLAKPLGEMVGNNYGAADAKAAQGAGQQAQWELEDRRASINDADAVQGKALDWSSNLVESDAATTRAILSNMA
jgi:hypothetical protein